jgi:predicted nucleic acid-binding protein
MSKTEDISRHRFSSADRIFLDANIWLYVYGPQGSPTDSKTRIYSSALSNALLAKSQILVDVLVVSEFVNRFSRIEYDVQYPNKANRPNFKQFRNSPGFKPLAQVIARETGKILGFSSRTESGFAAIDIPAMLTEFKAGEHDFNDQVLARLCQSQGLLLVTHDADFKGKGLDILTANKRIL